MCKKVKKILCTMVVFFVLEVFGDGSYRKVSFFKKNVFFGDQVYVHFIHVSVVS